MSVAVYRLRATFGQRWGGYRSLVLLLGLPGGWPGVDSGGPSAPVLVRRLVAAVPGRVAARTPTALLDRAG